VITCNLSPHLYAMACSLRPLVISGPSGSGTSTILKRLIDEFGDYFGFSVSHTTRKPRSGEIEGTDYHFVTREEMNASLAKGEFIEFTEFSGNLYGTRKQAIKEVQDVGKICILDLEIEGVKHLKKSDLNPLFVFVKPPNIQVLEERLRQRGTETEESINKRLSRAKYEMVYGEEDGNFDKVIVNDNINEAYQSLLDFILGDIEEIQQSRSMQTCS
jgi:guanylate kinase